MEFNAGPRDYTSQQCFQRSRQRDKRGREWQTNSTSKGLTWRPVHVKTFCSGENSLKAFVSKVWSDIQLHFEHAGEEGNQDLKPESFILKCDKVGEKYSTMNKETTNHEGPTETEKSRGFPCMRIPEMRSLYTAIPLWENQLWKTWPRLCEEAHASYTNHSLRTTATQKLSVGLIITVLGRWDASYKQTNYGDNFDS